MKYREDTSRGMGSGVHCPRPGRLSMWIAIFVLGMACMAYADEAGGARAVKPEAGPAVIAPDLPIGGASRNDLDSYGGWKGLKGRTWRSCRS